MLCLCAHAQPRRSRINDENAAIRQRGFLRFRGISRSVCHHKLCNAQLFFLQFTVSYIQELLKKLIFPSLYRALSLQRHRQRFRQRIFFLRVSKNKPPDPGWTGSRISRVNLHPDRSFSEYGVGYLVKQPLLLRCFVPKIDMGGIRILPIYKNSLYLLCLLISGPIPGADVDASLKILLVQHDAVRSILLRLQLLSLLIQCLQIKARHSPILRLNLHIIFYRLCSRLVRQAERKLIVLRICPYSLSGRPGHQLIPDRTSVQKHRCTQRLRFVSGFVLCQYGQRIGRLCGKWQCQRVDSVFMRTTVLPGKLFPALPVQLLHLFTGNRRAGAIPRLQPDPRVLCVQIQLLYGQRHRQPVSALVIRAGFRRIKGPAVRVLPLQARLGRSFVNHDLRPGIHSALNLRILSACHQIPGRIREAPENRRIIPCSLPRSFRRL